MKKKLQNGKMLSASDLTPRMAPNIGNTGTLAQLANNIVGPSMPVDQTNNNSIQNEFDPIMLSAAIRGSLNKLSFVSGMVARNRQNQYDYLQQSNLGQMNSIDASNFQPTTNNIYAQLGGALGLKSMQSGGRLNPNEMQEWNSYLDFVKTQGYEGSSDLDIKDKKLGENLFNQFKTNNPNTSINYDIVPRVQQELTYLRDQAQGFAKRRNDPNADQIMSGISPVDGWFGSKTSQFRFPSMTVNTVNNGNLVSSQNQGLLNGSFQTQSFNTPVTKVGNKPIPQGVKIEKLKDGYFYEDPNSGDLVELNNQSVSKLKRGGHIKTLESILTEIYGKK